jgi:hypothetical protein
MANRSNAPPPPFTFEAPPGGDISLRSIDGPVFCVHSIILGLASSTFSDMFSVAIKSGETIDLGDDSESISLMLAFIYPSHLSPTVDTFELLEKCLAIAQKYNMQAMTKALDRELSERVGGRLVSGQPLRAFRLAVTYGLRDSQTLAAKAIMPCHIDLREPAEIIKVARKHPTSAHVIGLLGVQALRAKILFDVMFNFCDGFLPTSPLVLKGGKDDLDEVEDELMMCDGCRRQSNHLYWPATRPGEYTPSWIHGWSRLVYNALSVNTFSACEHLFELSVLAHYGEEMEAPCGCIEAARQAKTYEVGRPGEVFEIWASRVRSLLEMKLRGMDCLYSL